MSIDTSEIEFLAENEYRLLAGSFQRCSEISGEESKDE